MAEYNSHRINLTTPNSRIELFMNDECVGQIDIGLNVKVTMHKPHISNKRPSTTKRGAQKEIDMAQGIFELEMEELLWNRKMLMDHMGYKGYRDIDKFVAYLTSNKYVTVEKEGRMNWFRTTGEGNLWLMNKYGLTHKDINKS